MPLQKKTADAIALNYLVSTKDEEVWRTTENGKHYQLETETGEITKGMGGKLTGQKVDPSKKKSASAKASVPAGNSKPQTAPSTVGAPHAKAKQYEEVVRRNAEQAARNPNNLTYKELAENYSQLAERAKKFDGTKREYTGIDGILALENVKNGERVKISGIGSWADGEYVKERRSAPGFHSGDIFKRADNRAFASNTGTLMTELGQIRGGKLTNNPNVKVELLNGSEKNQGAKPQKAALVENPSQGKSITSRSRKAAENSMIEGLDGIGDLMDSHDNEYVYQVPKGKSRNDIAIAACNAARKAGFQTEVWGKGSFSIVDPNNSYRSIDFSVSKPTNAGANADEYIVTIEHSY